MRTPSKSKKLRKGELVEVRQREEGLRGAWHEGIVIESSTSHRRVKYRHLLDDNSKDVLVESVRVSPSVEGWKNAEGDRRQPKQRGYIRPLPPPQSTEVRWECGLCVDALYDDAWWEGVIMDNSENSPKRSVFFPDEGDELMIPTENLRFTQDWDETRGEWCVRGHWMLAKLRSRCDRRGFSIKVVWYNVRTHHQFLSRVGEWVHGKQADWSECLNKVFKLLETEPSRQLIPGLNAPGSQNYLNNREESFLPGSRGWKISTQFRKTDEIQNSGLDDDSNPSAIVCCETLGQELPLDAVVGQDTPMVFSENANNLIERIGNGFCNPGEFSGKENCFEKESPKALRSLKTSTMHQFNSKNSSELSPQISRRCKSLTLAGGKLLERLNAGQRPKSTYKPSANFIHEDCLDAVLNYDPISNSSREIKAKAKIYLLQQGWRLEIKGRTSSERQDMHYVSPKGNIYYSLNQACLGWKEERNNGASQINNRSRQLVSRSKRLQGDGNKKRRVTCEGSSASELTHRTQTCNFLSTSVVGDFELRNTRGEARNLKRSRQAQLPVSGWSSKRPKLKLEGSMDAHKQNEAKSSCHLWKTKDTPAKWYRMPDLPSTPQRSNNSFSCQNVPTDMFNLSWLIKNGVVAENQQVFFMHGKEGSITRDGILCACCYRVHSLASFEAHAGNKFHQFSVNLRLDDGRSLAQCQMQALKKRMRASSEAKRMRAPLKENKKRAPLNKERKTDPSDEHDDFCFVCRNDGDMTLCDRCTRSFHAVCVHPEKIPGTEEWSKWFCPNCRCDKCGGGEFSDDENFIENRVLVCDQCECLFHVGCLDGIGMAKLASCTQGKWFCSDKCSEIFSELRNLVGKVNLVGNKGLSWTLLRSTEEDRDPSCDEIIAEENSGPLSDKVKAKRKLSVALSVMHECFSRIKEYRTRKDYVEEIIFNRGCERNLLKFQGFYTAILEKGNKLISVATVRVHGKRVVEMPLIATRTQYRRKGMCRLLLNELEKLLISLGIEKLVLPAIYQLESTWKKSFGFRNMTSEEMFDLLKLDIVHFQDTVMLQKMLMGASPEQDQGSCFNGQMQSLLKGFQHSGSALRKSFRIHKNQIKTIECHSGKTPMEDEVDESSVVIMGTTRSNRLVKQVKRKIGYSCRWEEHKPMRSVEHYLHHRKIYKRRRKDKLIVTDKLPANLPPDTLESSHKKDIQFGTYEIRKPDDGKLIICRRNSGIADGNCFSNIEADEPILDRRVRKHGSDHVGANRENVSGNSSTVNCDENYRETGCGHLGHQDSFKYVYMRRRKRKCSRNAFSEEMPCVLPVPAVSSKLSFNTVC